MSLSLITGGLFRAASRREARPNDGIAQRSWRLYLRLSRWLASERHRRPVRGDRGWHAFGPKWRDSRPAAEIRASGVMVGPVAASPESGPAGFRQIRPAGVQDAAGGGFSPFRDQLKSISERGLGPHASRDGPTCVLHAHQAYLTLSLAPIPVRLAAEGRVRSRGRLARRKPPGPASRASGRALRLSWPRPRVSARSR